jgi:hypothetical protein
MQPWGLVTDSTVSKIYDLYTEGWSVEAIAQKLKLKAVVVAGFIKQPQFQADLKLLQDDLNLRDICTPLGRMKLLQERAFDVVLETLIDPKSKKRFEAAQDVLDRAGDVPRRSKSENLSIQVNGHDLAMLAGTLREIGAVDVSLALPSGNEPERQVS